MSRVQLALNVDNLDEAITFYSKLFATGPAKVRAGYANFAITEPPLKLILVAGGGAGGTLNHLGVEVESTAAVDAAHRRLADEGLATAPQTNAECCYALQDKVWVNGPSGEPWEIYTVLADIDHAGDDGQPACADDGVCCVGPAASAEPIAMTRLV